MCPHTHSRLQLRPIIWPTSIVPRACRQKTGPKAAKAGKKSTTAKAAKASSQIGSSSAAVGVSDLAGMSAPDMLAKLRKESFATLQGRLGLVTTPGNPGDVLT